MQRGAYKGGLSGVGAAGHEQEGISWSDEKAGFESGGYARLMIGE